jgi:hypothetical protein
MARTDFQWGLGSATESTMSHEAIELVLYAENDAGCYKAYILPMLKACERKYLRLDGDLTKMLNGFARIACPIARQYMLEHGSMTDSWHSVFPVSVRREFAEYFARYFLSEFHAGNRFNTQKVDA